MACKVIFQVDGHIFGGFSPQWLDERAFRSLLPRQDRSLPLSPAFATWLPDAL